MIRGNTKMIWTAWCSTTSHLIFQKSRGNTYWNMCSRSLWPDQNGLISVFFSAWLSFTASYSSWWSRSMRTWHLGSEGTSRGERFSIGTRRMGLNTPQFLLTVSLSRLLWGPMRPQITRMVGRCKREETELTINDSYARV